MWNQAYRKIKKIEDYKRRAESPILCWSVSGEVATTTAAARRDEGAKVAAAAAGAGDGGMVVSNSREEDKSRAYINILNDGERGFGGHRWQGN